MPQRSPCRGKGEGGGNGNKQRSDTLNNHKGGSDCRLLQEDGGGRGVRGGGTETLLLFPDVFEVLY